MSSDDHDHHHHHHHTGNKVLGKIASKISAVKENITEVVKERTHSTTSDRRSSISSDHSSRNVDNVTYSVQDGVSSTHVETRPLFREYGDTESLGSITSTASYATSNVAVSAAPVHHGIEQLAINMGFGGVKQSSLNPPSSPSTSATTNKRLSSASLISSSSNPVFQPVTSPTGSQVKFDLSDATSLNRGVSSDTENEVQERVVTTIDADNMTAKPTVVTVPKDPARRAAMLLAGPKFQLNYNEIPKEKLQINTDIIYTVAIVVGVISLLIAIWKPISSYCSGLMVGMLFAAGLFYMWVRIFINKKVEENAIEEWVDFPALEALVAKCDKENKNTNIQVTGASIAFQRYDADRDDDFARYPCDIRLDGYRLVVHLASKQWADEKKPEKEMKFVGYREYLVKEARMILVPEATLTRGKYWMNDYPIIIQDLQLLDKEIHSKQQFEKSKLDTNDFFTNTATVLSIWFETAPQKEEWFHKISLVLRKGKEEIGRTNSLTGGSTDSLSSPGSSPSLYRRLAQTETDAELTSNRVSESTIDAVLTENQQSAGELLEKATVIEPDKEEVDASGTHRTAVRKSKKLPRNEASLQRILQSPECLDEAAITINFLARRLLCDMFELSFLKDLIKTKVEMKLKEIAISILEDLRVTSIDVGNTFPVILKIEPMQWNTQGIWFNLFLYYRGNFKLSVRTRVLLQRLINFNPKKDKPVFAQHHSAQIVHKDDERIDEDDLVSRQKLLAKEPEIPEMAVTRKLGLALTRLALSKRFQSIANIPFFKNLMEKFSEKETGADIEVTSFSGVLTLNIPPPPSDRIWVGFPEMPSLNIKVVPIYGENKYDYTLLQDFLSARIRAELKRLVVLPAMDDQLLPFFRDWAIDIIGEIVKKPIDPETDDYKAKLNAQASVRAGLEDYKKSPSVKKQTSTTSAEETYL